MQSLEEIKMREGRSDEELTRDELKVLRKYIGKLNGWQQTQDQISLYMH